MSTKENGEKDIYNAMLILAMLAQNGYLSIKDVATCLYNVLCGALRFSEDVYPATLRDKSAWVQTIIEQAVGRLCRTKNKPHTTHILYDRTMEKYFDYTQHNKSLTKEYQRLASYIQQRKDQKDHQNSEEVENRNNADKSQRFLDYLKKRALIYVNKTVDEIADERQNEFPEDCKTAQYIYQKFIDMILRKPTISSLDDLSEQERQMGFSKFYGSRKQDADGGYAYDSDTNRISPDMVRLDVMMKNPIIRQYFERCGYATSWEPKGMILHPNILRYEYAGAIGEEAFKAILIDQGQFAAAEIQHLQDFDYELADYVLYDTDKDGNKTYTIAIDVKNINTSNTIDREGNIPTHKKRNHKLERLGCKMITVNILQLDNPSIDKYEIGGLINNNGELIAENVSHLISLINKTHENRRKETD